MAVRLPYILVCPTSRPRRERRVHQRRTRGLGGGAIQIAGRSQLSVRSRGSLRAPGQGGAGGGAGTGNGGAGGSGGGSGGAIFLEAESIVVADEGFLNAPAPDDPP